ncbi:hypothetical protein [Paludisphaera mucosa]|uniref:GNAT family N-acetyltransferase n=1 Tax=Paludisphaera mucosa TaxID=3030827 RepID=A0ABT6FDR4_9BACT|nr:hypothetical protein [Paludisphaera mucosa]MDG3005722.1 hypothetical protein [Paludisphaera mucosa]
MSKNITIDDCGLRRMTLDDQPLLIQLMFQLLEKLAGQGDGLESVERFDRSITRWHDADYDYIDIDLPEDAELEADINVHDGKAFIRLMK